MDIVICNGLNVCKLNNDECLHQKKHILRTGAGTKHPCDEMECRIIGKVVKCVKCEDKK